MTLNASRQLDLNFDGRNWKNGQDIQMFVKFKWNENQYDGNTDLFAIQMPGLSPCQKLGDCFEIMGFRWTNTMWTIIISAGIVGFVFLILGLWCICRKCKQSAKPLEPEDGANKKKSKKREKNPDIMKRQQSLRADKANLTLEQRKETVLKGTKWDPTSPKHEPETKVTPKSKLVARKITKSPTNTDNKEIAKSPISVAQAVRQNSEESKIVLNSPPKKLQRRDSISSQVRRRLSN